MEHSTCSHQLMSRTDRNSSHCHTGEATVFLVDASAFACAVSPRLFCWHLCSHLVSNFSIRYFHSSLLVAMLFLWHPGMFPDLGPFQLLSCNSINMSLHHNLPAKYVWNLRFTCHCNSECSYMLISIWQSPQQCRCLSCSQFGLPSLSSWLSIQETIKLNFLILSVMPWPRTSHSAIYPDLVSSHLPSLFLWAIQSRRWQICHFHSLQKDSWFWACPWGSHLSEISQGLKNFPLSQQLN